MRIHLLQHSPTHLAALRAGASAYQQLTGFLPGDGLKDMVAGPETSPEFIARQEAATDGDVWLHGFAVIETAQRAVIGLCGYKGPPTTDGSVEIAYGLAAAWRGRGYATEAAQEMVKHAFAGGLVRRVIAHTLPEPNASTRVLTRCGFVCCGEVTDPDDGPVWRWEKTP